MLKSPSSDILALTKPCQKSSLLYINFVHYITTTVSKIKYGHIGPTVVGTLKTWPYIFPTKKHPKPEFQQNIRRNATSVLYPCFNRFM